jgi:hypothetical protein
MSPFLSVLVDLRECSLQTDEQSHSTSQTHTHADRQTDRQTEALVVLFNVATPNSAFSLTRVATLDRLCPNQATVVWANWLQLPTERGG